jgi:DNA-directed RNA polymerase, mitochondrial
MNTSLQAIQIALEEEGTALGYQRYQSQLEARQANGRDVDGGVVAAAIRRNTKLLADAIVVRSAEAKGKPGRLNSAVKLLDQLDLEPEALAMLTLRAALTGAGGQQNAWTTVAQRLANDCINEWNFRRLSAEDPKAYEIMQKHLPKKKHGTRHARRVTQHETGSWETLTNEERIHLGSWLVDTMVEVTGLFDTTIASDGKGHGTRVLSPTADFLSWLRDAHQHAALLRPVRMPMVVPPKPWTGPVGGGYLSNASRPLELVRTRNTQYLRSLAQYDLSEVLAAVNAVQETAWRINTNVLDAMQRCWNAGLQVGDLITGDPKELPPFPSEWEGKVAEWKVADPEGYKDWAVRAAITHADNDKLTSKRYSAAAKLGLAEKFKDFDAIYFPHTLDFRGRLYPVPQYLTPQGDDLAKALLCFSEGKPLGARGAYWLKVHLANTFGVDKVSFAERVEWVEDRMELLLASAIDPLTDRFWTEADDPWQCLAACFDLLGLHINGEGHVSHLSIPMDGSCNGLQNFSALLRDSVGGKATNLVPQEKPADIYTEVAKVVAARVRQDALQGNPLAIIWDGNITRKMVKQPVMTLPYGATLNGMKGQIDAAMRKNCPTLFPRNETWAAATYLAGVTYESIGQVVIAARSAMDWLREVAKLAAREDYPVRWTSPMGLPIVQDYREAHGHQVRLHIRGRSCKLNVSTDGDKLNRRRQTAGISPNLIHSYDAAHLMRTVLVAKANGLTSFGFIHDSYGTHAADTDLLHACLREAFVEQYSQPLLQQFRDDIAQQLPPDVAADLPELPPVGELDLEVIKASRYFFA